MKILFIILLVFVLLLALILLESRREMHKIKIAEYTIQSPKLPGIWKGKNLVFFSDFHNSMDGKMNGKILQAIDAAKPEMILIGGDMIVGREAADTRPATELLNQLAKKYPVYYGKGNHELRVAGNLKRFGSKWEDYRNSLNPDILYLEDARKVLFQGADSRVVLYGLDLERYFYKRFRVQNMPLDYLEQKLGKPDPAAFNILLAHNPDYFPEYARWGADLVLSGHVHGGIIRLPILGGVASPRLTLFPKYDRGLFVLQNQRMLLSSGLGQHSLPIRVGNPPEIVVIHIA